MRKSLKILLIILALFFIVIPALMAAFKVCPPSGPWPSPPWCEGGVEISPIPVSQLPAVMTKELALNLTVTVPYWTQGDVYLGVGDNLTYLKLDKVNEATYKGKANLEKGTVYYYSSGAENTREVSTDRKVVEEEIFDAVVDWVGSNKQIVKKNFQKSFYVGACHFCGVSFTKGNFIEPIKRTYDEIKRIGGTWVNIVPVWFIVPDYRGNELKPIYSEEFKGTTGWVHATIKDEDLITLINEAHARGLKVYLTPHVAPENWGPGVKGKGDIRPSNPDQFFESYKNFINHYADIAQKTGVEMFSIGNELDSATQEDIQLEVPFDKTAKWRDVIRSVRQQYKGTLTYSVACITEERCGPQIIKFWDDLDVIGWEWYVPIATKEHEPIDSMKANAERIIRNNIKPLFEKYGKPIVFTEIGWEAYPGACAHTYGVGSAKGGDRIEQASCYEAVFQAIEDEDFIKGMHVWAWTANLEEDRFPWIWTDSANEVRFSITEKEIAKWYDKIED